MPFGRSVAVTVRRPGTHDAVDVLGVLGRVQAGGDVRLGRPAPGEPGGRLAEEAAGVHVSDVVVRLLRVDAGAGMRERRRDVEHPVARVRVVAPAVKMSRADARISSNSCVLSSVGLHVHTQAAAPATSGVEKLVPSKSV